MSCDLVESARHADGLVAQGRAELVAAVRAAADAGMTQTEIAAAIGRSQPEVSRLLHFHGRSPLGRRLRAHAPAIRRLIREAGGGQVRVFGSVAAGADHEGSDVDLLFTMATPLSLMELGGLEAQISELVGASVDLVPDTSLRPGVRDRVMKEAVLL